MAQGSHKLALGWLGMLLRAVMWHLGKIHGNEEFPLSVGGCFAGYKWDELPTILFCPTKIFIQLDKGKCLSLLSSVAQELKNFSAQEEKKKKKKGSGSPTLSWNAFKILSEHEL